MPEPTRVLFVDDDSTLRKLWTTILTDEGFAVQDVASVPEALLRITSQSFDVLIADLNIGEAGDGFTVVSAMRRVQPHAVTLILTGYPAFQAALRAIHEQVDDFLTKPADPESLIGRIRDNLSRRKKPSTILTKRLPEIIQQERQAIIQEWYQAVLADPELARIRMSREERIDHLPGVFDELVRPRVAGTGIETDTHQAATQHGRARRQQGYTPSMLLEETRILHRVIADCVQHNLLLVDVSNVLPDLIEVDDRLHQILRYSMEALLGKGPVSDAA